MLCIHLPSQGVPYNVPAILMHSKHSDVYTVLPAKHTTADTANLSPPPSEPNVYAASTPGL